MSNTTRHRESVADNPATSGAAEGAGRSLRATRADVDRLFAVAAKSFQSMSEGNSQDFLARSRQTSGE